MCLPLEKNKNRFGFRITMPFAIRKSVEALYPPLAMVGQRVKVMAERLELELR